jgi:hypothetical protein
MHAGHIECELLSDTYTHDGLEPLVSTATFVTRRPSGR